jgi:hypothetical protein
MDDQLSYILLSTMAYEGMWIHGVVKSLDEGLDFFLDKILKTKPLSETKMSSEELVNRALCDNWQDDYWTYWVEVWNGTQRVCIYKFNTLTKMLDKQKPRFGESESENES